MNQVNYAFPGRTFVALATMAIIGVVIAVDFAATDGIDPFSAPPPIALGSGQAPGGAHCTGV